MSKVLTVEQREQAGSDSYNRFEYQVHWIVCHIIGKLQENAECIVFCEFHDDMAEFSPNNQQYQFFQIKTKEESSEWTISEMSKREKKKSGGYKKSFLGFIFYNYLIFGAECSHCHFVSNNDFDKEVLLWQSYIEDEKKLQTENNELYEKIKDRIKNEFRCYIMSKNSVEIIKQEQTYKILIRNLRKQQEEKNNEKANDNLVFYKINDESKEVTVYAVVDQRQDYLNIIRGL